MEEYVYIDGKKYKRGYTTGSAATGAAKSAVFMLKNKVLIDKIIIDTPKGIKLTLNVENAFFNDDYAIASIKKDGGDDIDATHNIDVFAKVSWREDNSIFIDGGIGIGRVTKKGLGINVGDAAINKVPRQMIEKEVREISKSVGVDVTIYVPSGEEIAKKTFNPRLGIEGGISIIGTTGIVEPMSEEGWKKSLSIELNMKKEQGFENIIFVPGNHGEKFVTDILNINSRYICRTSNFIGYMLYEAKRMNYKKILFIGHIGKFIKLAGGIFHTHSKMADCRMEILISHLALMGMEKEHLKEINECITTEGAIDIVKREGYERVFDCICKESIKRINTYLNDDNIQVEIIMFTMDNEIIGKSENALNLLEVYA